MTESNSFFQGEKSIGSVYREMGFARFAWSLLKADKGLLFKRIAAGLNNKYSIFMKKHRYKVLLPVLKIRDFMDVNLRKRKMIPLHRKLKALRHSQQEA